MKNYWKYIKAVIALALIIFLYGFAEKRNNARKLNHLDIQFTENENLYINEEAVNKLLIQNNLVVASLGKEALDLNRVEKILNRNEMIENAEVYVTLDGVLKTKICQRRPIGRVIGPQNYYVDRLGKKMPLSSNYSARVPILSGVREQDIKEVYPILDYINQDTFLTEHIIALKRLNGGYYEMELRQIDFEIFFGKAERIDRKFNNFKAFYKKAVKDSLINTYKMVDLQFGNQVVCTKK